MHISLYFLFTKKKNLTHWSLTAYAHSLLIKLNVIIKPNFNQISESEFTEASGICTTEMSIHCI